MGLFLFSAAPNTRLGDNRREQIILGYLGEGEFLEEPTAIPQIQLEVSVNVT